MRGPPNALLLREGALMQRKLLFDGRAINDSRCMSKPKQHSELREQCGGRRTTTPGLSPAFRRVRGLGEAHGRPGAEVRALVADLAAAHANGAVGRVVDVSSPELAESEPALEPREARLIERRCARR